MSWNVKERRKKKGKKKHNPKRAFLSVLCNRIENFTIQIVTDHLKDKFYRTKSRFNAALCYDEIMIPKILFKNEMDLKQFIIEAQNKIHNILGIDIELLNKPLKLELHNAIK